METAGKDSAVSLMERLLPLIKQLAPTTVTEQLRRELAPPVTQQLQPDLRSLLPTAPAPVAGETVSQAAAAWFSELERTGRRGQTLEGHQLRVKAFTDHAGDLPLAGVTRAMAADFRAHIAAGRANRTVNKYMTTLACVFKSARQRGRFQGDNPFEDQRLENVGKSYQPFAPSELQTLFAALPRDVAPARHSPETALPWVSRLSAPIPAPASKKSRN